VSYALRPYS